MNMAGPKAMAGMDKDYMAECDLKTMIEAEKIKKDKTRHAAAMKKHKELMAAMESMGMHGKGKDMKKA